MSLSKQVPTPAFWIAPLVGACLVLSACNRNSDNSNSDVLAGQGAHDGSLDASTMDALTSAQEPAMDVTAAVAAEQNAKAASSTAVPATAKK